MSNSEQNAVENMRKLRDEIRVKMHLAEMDARDWWQKVEPQLERMEDQLEAGATKAARYAELFAEELSSALTRVRDRLQQADSDD